VNLRAKLTQIERGLRKQSGRELIECAETLLDRMGQLAWAMSQGHRDGIVTAASRYADAEAEADRAHRKATQGEMAVLEAWCAATSLDQVLDEHARRYALQTGAKPDGAEWPETLGATRTRLAGSELYQDVVPSHVWDALVDTVVTP
jgi:hypothetical protein